MIRTLPLVLAACSGALPPGQGRSRLDRDGDGWSPADGDCDDRDAGFHPLAADLPDDDLDQDCDGEDDEALDLRSIGPGDLVVTEIMADPAIDPSLGEWFEVTNRSGYDLDLVGLLVRDLATEDFTVLDEAVVDPGAAVVFGAWDDPDVNGGVDVEVAWSGGFGLTNAGDAIVLSYAGFELDRVEWDPTWPLLEGASLSLDPLAEDNEAPTAWCAGTEDYGEGGFGTPGASNPACPPPFEGVGIEEVEPGDLVITEVMQDPLAVPNELGEWFEVLNTSDRAIDLDGLEVSDDSGDGFTVGGFQPVEPGAYVVLGSFLEGNGGAPIAVEWRWSFSLANSGDTIRLSYGTVVLDEIAYDDGLTFPDPEGASMSLDPAELDDNHRGSRWCIATTPYGDGDLGTPGEPNPPCP